MKVYAPKGSEWSSEEFSCAVDKIKQNRFENWLSVGDKKSYATTGGRSADGPHAPFFNIKNGKLEEGYIVAIGWTGQWNAEIERKEESVIFKSKIEDAHFKILPGEKFRTSSITVMGYQGTVENSQNGWRRFVKDIYSPIGKGGVPEFAPFCASLWGGMSTKGCLERIEKIEKAKLPFDHFWMDAGWYGAGVEESPDEYVGDWSLHTGDWTVNKVRHPDGLKDVVAKIKESGKRFLLWLEPERVRENVPIVAEHPEYFIDIGGGDLLLDLGKEEAWKYCVETVSEIIKKLNVSVYRQDFNFRPLEHWRKNDQPDRVGITEIKHINGLYRFWDALIERFPGLLIDNCASGGRRIDIETLRRSVPLWRTDSQCPRNRIPELAQAQAINFGSWMPYSGTACGCIWFDDYCFRSAYSPAMTSHFANYENQPFHATAEEIAWLDKMSREFLRVRPYLSEDVYPLTSASDSLENWLAIQYHDPIKDEGVIQVFKRENSPYPEANFKLQGLTAESDYAFEDADGGEFIEKGEALLLSGLSLRIKENRVAKVYFYKKK